MKVVALVSSPRREANTDLLVQQVLASAVEKGADTKVYYLNELQIKGCKGCFTCKSQEKCDIHDDDVTLILDDVASADAVILGTPVYMWGMSGQLKLVIDRMFMFLNADHFSSKLAPGKKVLWAVTQAQPNAAMFASYFHQAGKMLQMTGFSKYRVLIAPGTVQNKDDVLKQEKTLAKARELGKWLVEVDLEKSSLSSIWEKLFSDFRPSHLFFRIVLACSPSCTRILHRVKSCFRSNHSC